MVQDSVCEERLRAGEVWGGRGATAHGPEFVRSGAVGAVRVTARGHKESGAPPTGGSGEWGAEADLAGVLPKHNTAREHMSFFFYFIFNSK